MIKVNVRVIPYLFIYFELCFVNNQYPDGMIKLKQGNIIGVRITINSYFISFYQFAIILRWLFLVESLSRNLKASLFLFGDSLCNATNKFT